MKLSLLFLLSALVFSIGNAENQPQRRALTDEVSEEVGVKRLAIAELVAHSRQERQATCNNQTDCLPPSLSGVPTDLIDCDSGFCVCRQCFELDGDRCRELAPCQTYSRSTRSCDDARRSQLVALLLSIFLSEVGAANFYIGRNDLAGGQLAIFLMSFVVIFVAACPCCFLCCCKDESGERTIVAFVGYIIAIVVGVVIAVICSLMILAWWIADLVIFIQNSRLDEQNCMLRSFAEGA